MRTHAESLMGRVDRVLSNTVQTILDGNNFLSAFGCAFGNPSSNVIERDGVEPSAHTRSSTIHDNNYTNVHAIDSNVRSPAHPDAPPLVEDDERLGHPAPSPEGMPPRTQRMTTDPPLRLNEAMDREFSPRRADETEEQYDNRYNAHLRCHTSKLFCQYGQDFSLYLTIFLLF